MTDQEFRIEHDTMGEVKVPAKALWRAQTQRAVENFPISGRPLESAQIRAMGLLKAACAKVNIERGLLPEEKGQAIVDAALRIADNEFDAEFPIDRSEERRVGKECRARGWRDRYKNRRKIDKRQL